jgi:ankyrin repeat protein
MYFRALNSDNCEIEMINFLLSKAPKLIKFRKEGRTPLCLACKNLRSPEIIKTLFEADPSVIDVPDKSGTTPLYYRE